MDNVPTMKETCQMCKYCIANECRSTNKTFRTVIEPDSEICEFYKVSGSR